MSFERRDLRTLSVGLTRKVARGIEAPERVGSAAVAPGSAAKVGGLVLTRHLGQSIMIGVGIEVEIVGIKSATARIRIVAPREVTVHRREVYEAIQADGQPAKLATSADRLNSLGSVAGVRGQGGLVLTRRIGETIMIGDDVAVEVVDIRPSAVKLRIAAPREVSVHRREVFEAIHGAD